MSLPSLSIDLESRSAVELKRTGVYPYAAHPTTSAWCACFALDEEEPQVWRPGQPVPQLIVDHLARGGLFRAWNAEFERVMIRDCMGRLYGWPEIPIHRWRDTMAEARAMSLPGALGLCAHAVGLQEGKDEDGRKLMLQMAKPRSYDVLGNPIWWDDEQRQLRLIDYCKQDVRTERNIAYRVVRLPKQELLVWMLTSWMNDRGVRLDLATVEGAQAVVEMAMRRLNAAMSDTTGGLVISATTVRQIADWLRSIGYEIEKLDKVALRDMLKLGYPEQVHHVLEIRRDAAKTSAAKLKAFMLRAMGERMYGSLMYHAASTGRWSSVGAQLHNVPRETVADPDTACQLLRDRDIDGIEFIYGPALMTISKTLRPMIIAAEGCELLIADYAAIEARGTAWLAGQVDLIEAFARGVDIYCEMGEVVFHHPVTKADILERFVGKQLVLGCGYQMGWERFIAHCAVVGDITIDEDLAVTAVHAYRNRYAAIPACWKELQQAAYNAVAYPKKGGWEACQGRVLFQMSGSFLVLRLPSGRCLFYPYARIALVTPPWDRDKPEEERGEKIPAVVHQGILPGTNHWGWLPMYGGKWMENIVQALCRDVMAHALLQLRGAEWNPVLTVHDEIVCEEIVGRHSVEDLIDVMCELPDWAEGLPVKAEGWRGQRYGKG